jgi:hypothetical protein
MQVLGLTPRYPACLLEEPRMFMSAQGRKNIEFPARVKMACSWSTTLTREKPVCELSSRKIWSGVIPFPDDNRSFHPRGMTANSRGLSEAIPPAYDLNRPAPRRGASKRRFYQKSSGTGIITQFAKITVPLTMILVTVSLGTVKREVSRVRLAKKSRVGGAIPFQTLIKSRGKV